MGRHLPYGITQCYLPPATSKRAPPPPNPSQTGRYSIYLPRRDGRLSWPSCLDSAPTGSRTSDLSITSATLNYYTTKTTIGLSHWPLDDRGPVYKWSVGGLEFRSIYRCGDAAVMMRKDEIQMLLGSSFSYDHFIVHCYHMNGPIIRYRDRLLSHKPLIYTGQAVYGSWLVCPAQF